MGKKVVVAQTPKRFTLTQADPNVSLATSFGASWVDAFTYECPQNTHLVLQAGDHFSVKFYDSADVEYVAPDALVKIEVRDPSGRSVERIYGPANYKKSSEFQDGDKKCHLRLEHPLVVNPGDKLVIMNLDSTGMDTASMANSFFSLETTQLK